MLIPGPAFLALLGIGAGQGRKAGAFFMSGHLVGDLIWSSLALVAIVGAKTIGTFVFDLLGLLCGFYLAWIGWNAVTAKLKGDGKALLNVDRPFRRGLIFGVTNPKRVSRGVGNVYGAGGGFGRRIDVQRAAAAAHRFLCRLR